MAICSMVVACSSGPESELSETHNNLQRGPEAMVYDEGWRVDQHLRFVQDVNQDSRGDLVGFGDEGVFVAEAKESGGYGEPTLELSTLGRNQGWTVDGSVRTLADVNGDGLLDIVGFGSGAVVVALRSAAGYSTATPWTTDFTTAAGWTSAHVRFMGDVTGDGKADIVGIDDWGVYVAQATASHFAPKQMWIRHFSASQGWDSTKHPRLLADVNGDGLADLVGFGGDRVYVSKSNGVRFDVPTQIPDVFGYDDGWRIESHVRAVANLDGDRYADLIGIGPNGVEVVLGTETGFKPKMTWSSEFGDATGWLADQHVRLIGDVDGDGYDDVVGIKDSRVYVARNTGTNTAFAPLAEVSDEFTPAKGWEVAKHPRFLTDVDADGQLDLLGFANDAVYWDRLTPAVTIPSDWTTPTCAASRLGPPAPGFCEGPWRYTKKDRIVSQHESCEKVCTANLSCAKWENGVSTVSSIVSPSQVIRGAGDRLCTQVCNSTGCNPTRCTGSISQPTVACQSAASGKLSELRTHASNAVLAETNFDSAAAQNQRRVEAQNAASVTPTYVIGQFDFVSHPEGPGGTLNSWHESWVCRLSVRTPVAVTAPNEACGCADLGPGTCEHDAATSSTLFTEPGELRPIAPGVSAQECMTYDDLPMGTPAQVQAKFEKLWSAQTIAPTTVSSGEFQRALVNRMKLIYELWGDQLVNQRTPTDQLHRAISLYGAHPDINPSCAAVDAPEPPASCTAAQVTTTHGDLVRCQRLVAQHASDSVASIASTECTALMNGYLDLAAQPADDAVCGGPHLREVGAKTVFQLVDKQLGAITSAPTSLGALQRQLWILDDWFTVSKRSDSLGVFSEADQQHRDTSYLLGRFWDRVRERSGADEALKELSESSTPDEAEQALGVSAVANRQLEQAVVSALFTVPGVIMPENVTLTRPPLRSLPLLALLGDTLKPLQDDLNGLAVYHDIACQFRDCRAPTTNTPSRNAWRILASLEEPGLGTAVSANPFALGGWNAAFGKLASQQPALLQAISDAVDDPGGLAGAMAEEDVHPLARQLWLLYKRARAFHSHYEATGLFESTAENRLYGSLLQQHQQDVVNALRGRANALGGTVAEYRSGLISVLQSQLAVMDAGAQLSDLTNTRLRKATEMDHKLATVNGLRASGEDQADAFASLAKSFADVQAALDEGAHVQNGDTVTFDLDGRSGRFAGSRDPSVVAAHTITGLTAGEMLLVQTSGSWTPTCSISTKNWQYGDHGDPVPTDLSNAAIGPEGYTLSVSGSSVMAHSAVRARSSSFNQGASMKVCVHGGVSDVIGISVEACVHSEVSRSSSWTLSDNSGTEARTTAAFATGLRLDDTPFPQAPVGSLLVVLTDPVSGVIRDVRVVHSGVTSILIEGPSTAYFVANDKQCTTASTVNKLSVTARPMLSSTDVANKALVAMADVLNLLRQQQETLAAQGTMLPTQTTLIRQQANQLLQVRLGEIAVAALPDPLASLWDAFVSHEIVATERRIQINAVLRSLDLDFIELRIIGDELAAGATRARLQRLVPQWMLRDLDHDHLRRRLVDLLSVSRDYLKPILDLWYPRALDNVSFGSEINALLNADVGTSLVSLAGAGQEFVRTLLNAYEIATFGAKPNAPELPVVVLSFPRPGFSPTNTFWREAEAARAQRVWDAIDSHTTAYFEITPNDFYSRNGGDAILSCNEVMPLIKTMALYVVRPGADFSNQTLNALGRTFQGYGGANQSFVTVEGPRLYQLADPDTGLVSVWQGFNMPVRYGDPEATLITFAATPRQTRPVGLSAAGSFEIDFSVLNTLPQSGALGVDDPWPATEVQLVLEIDSRASGTRPTWVSRCQ